MPIAFRERRRTGKREGWKNRCERENQSIASYTCPNWDQTHSPGVYPDRKLNPQPLGFTG